MSAEIKEFRGLDTEIKDAGKTLGAMRKRRKALDGAILTWMQTQGFVRVKLSETQFLERNVKSHQKPVNADMIVGVLTQYFDGDDDRASSLASLIYDSRPVDEHEILKVIKESGKKRSVRPVDGTDAGVDA